MIVVDASLFASWLLNESSDASGDAVWNSLVAETVLVPAHWTGELAAALCGAVASKRIRAEEVEAIIERVKLFDFGYAGPIPVETLGKLVDDATQLRLSASHMSYLMLAREHKLPLATLDEDLRRAAARLNIPLLPA